MENNSTQHEETAPVKQYVAMTPGEATAWYVGTVCPCCSRAKTSHHTFCVTDNSALPLFLRNWLSRGPGDPYFVDNYRRALQHLVDQPVRRTRYTNGRAVRWTFTSMSELEAAGFRFCNHARCEVPGCGMRITWYRTPSGGKMAVAYEDFRPHFETCKDPEYFARRKEEKAVQASARRAAKSKRRA